MGEKDRGRITLLGVKKSERVVLEKLGTVIAIDVIETVVGA